MMHAGGELNNQFPALFTTMQHRGQEIDVVWFKRDLCIRDHAPLAQALREAGAWFCCTRLARRPRTPTPATPPDVPVAGVTSLCAEVCVGLGSGNGSSGGEALEVLKHLHGSEGIGPV